MFNSIELWFWQLLHCFTKLTHIGTSFYFLCIQCMQISDLIIIIQAYGLKLTNFKCWWLIFIMLYFLFTLIIIIRLCVFWSQIFSSHNISSQDYLSQQQLVTITNRHMAICRNDSLSQEISSQFNNQLVTMVVILFFKS